MKKNLNAVGVEIKKKLSKTNLYARTEAQHRKSNIGKARCRVLLF